MNKNNGVDINAVNMLIKACNKIIQNIHIFVLILTIYIAILILNKLEIIYFISTIFDILAPLFIGVLVAWLIRPIIN